MAVIMNKLTGEVRVYPYPAKRSLEIANAIDNPGSDAQVIHCVNALQCGDWYTVLEEDERVLDLPMDLPEHIRIPTLYEVTNFMEDGEN